MHASGADRDGASRTSHGQEDRHDDHKLVGYNLLSLESLVDMVVEDAHLQPHCPLELTTNTSTTRILLWVNPGRIYWSQVKNAAETPTKQQVQSCIG